jgi:3-oxoacyl-(acyl-carrier-protein) synthase
LNLHDPNGNVRDRVPIPIPITGVGVVSAFGDSADAFRTALLEGRTGIAPAPEFAAQGCRSTLAARIAGFDAATWIPPMKLRRMDDTGPLALVITRQAQMQARHEVAGEGDDRTGVVLGTYSAGGQATTDYLTALFSGGPSGAPALLFNSTVGNAAAGLTGLEFKLRGPNLTVSHKEASSLAAIATAVDLVRQRRVDAIIAGGIDSIYDLFYRVHDRFEVMSDAPEAGSATAPFGENRSGFVLGEGGFGLWLEQGDAVQARGASVLAEIVGVGAASAATALNAWPDTPGPLARTMRLALDDAGLGPEAVDVVYASANASPVLDDVEAEALTGLFGGSRTVVTSIKGAIGESGASGAAACVAAVLCGALGAIPPIAGLVESGRSALSLNLARRRVDGPARVALINSCASGGALFSVVIRVEPAGARSPKPEA